MKKRRRSFRNCATALLAAAVFLSTVALAGCGRSDEAAAQKASLSKCQAQLGAIPGMEPLLKPRSKAAEDEGGRPLEGLELALTINGTIQTQNVPEENEDDSCTSQNGRESLAKLLDALKQNEMPPTVDFVAGRFMDLGLQLRWVESGNELGNLTYGRLKSRHNSSREFVDDVILNEQALAPLWEKFPPKRKYFRYPRLKMSSDPVTREQVRAYLQKSGYVEVPGTIDARDWRFGQIYCAAEAYGDRSCANYVKQCFFTLLLDTTQKARAAAKNIAGYDARHILFVEATRFTSENLAEIIRWYKRLGARFIPLDDALSDPLYTKLGDDGETGAAAVFREVKELQANNKQRDK